MSQHDEILTHHTVNGSNVMLWTVKDARQFFIDLMTATFTKEEMGRHLAFYICSWPEENK